MKYPCLLLLLILTFCADTTVLKAQTPGTGKISAKVVDAQNGETIPFATAIVINRRTKAVVKGAQTDANGK